MNIGIYIYDNVEVLDFAGAFEVFSTAKRLANNDWHIFLLAENSNVVNARGNFPVLPHFSIENAPKVDVLIIAGGVHTAEVKNEKVINWIGNIAKDVEWLTSVCTGVFLLAEANVINGLEVTTHWEDISSLKNDYPSLKVIDNKRWVQSGNVITSAGISAGIDMSLYLVSQLASLELANKTAKQMDYRWQNNL